MTGGYGTGADILHDCTIAVDKGEIAVIVGPNGAGKSTAMKAVFGMLNLRRRFGAAGRRRHHPPDAAGPRGQGHGLCAADLEHLHLDDGGGKPRNGGLPAPRRHRATMEQVYDLFPILRDKRQQAAGELSRRSAPAGRGRPRADDQTQVLMLDEPTAGVSPIVMDELFDRIIEVARTGISILMVEQNARQALEIADKGYVLVQGATRFTDTGKALLADPEVRRSFLGG